MTDSTSSLVPLWIRALTPSWGSHPHDFISPCLLPKALSPTTIRLGVRASTSGFGGGENKHPVHNKHFLPYVSKFITFHTFKIRKQGWHVLVQYKQQTWFVSFCICGPNTHFMSFWVSFLTKLHVHYSPSASLISYSPHHTSQRSF